MYTLRAYTMKMSHFLRWRWRRRQPCTHPPTTPPFPFAPLSPPPLSVLRCPLDGTAAVCCHRRCCLCCYMVFCCYYNAITVLHSYTRMTSRRIIIVRYLLHQRHTQRFAVVLRSYRVLVYTRLYNGWEVFRVHDKIMIYQLRRIIEPCCKYKSSYRTIRSLEGRGKG